MSANRPYNPSLTQNLTNDELPAYIHAELLKLSQALEEQRKVMFLDELHVEPSRKVDNMIVFADGTNWNPGSGKGIYRWDVDVSPSAWVYVG